ncbi:MAG: ATP-binding cassette domain-containing protein [Pseudomonadota bacterium]
MTRKDEALRLHKVTIQLAERTLIDIDREIQPGDVLTVMGSSGSGKSTLLAFIAGFLDPVFVPSGRVTLAGTDITGKPPENRRVGLLFQDPLLFPHMSVGQNLLFAVRAGDRGDRDRKVRDALEQAGLAEFHDRDPATLSGGQKARAALMRVMLSEPHALLLDEPFSRLDADRRSLIREFVFSEARRRQLPVLLVTHDSEDAEQAGGPVFHLD